MVIQDKSTKNIIKSKDYPKSKILRELDKLDTDGLLYCNEAMYTMLLLTELEEIFVLTSIGGNICFDIQGVWTERSEVHEHGMSEQKFLIWTEISVNKSFIV